MPLLDPAFSAAVSLAIETAGCHTGLPNLTTMSLFDDPSVGTIPEPTFSVTELSDAIGNAVRAAFRDAAAAK